MLAEGPESFWSELRRSGLKDTTGVSVSEVAARAGAEGHPLHEFEVRRILQNPLSATVHAVYAETLLVRGVAHVAGLEATIALALGAESSREHYIVAEALASSNQVDAALEELERAVSLEAEPSAYGVRASRLREILLAQRARAEREARPAARH